MVFVNEFSSQQVFSSFGTIIDLSNDTEILSNDSPTPGNSRKKQQAAIESMLGNRDGSCRQTVYLLIRTW